MLITSMQASPVELLSTAEVAHRLGVKPQTVYAYVSRGLLRRDPSSAHRRSWFRAQDVERLVARARRPDRSGALEVIVETELTALDPAGRLHYRGRDAVELARFSTFEEVSGLLWDGDPLAPWELAEAAAGWSPPCPRSSQPRPVPVPVPVLVLVLVRWVWPARWTSCRWS